MMESLYLLIPLSILMLLAGVAVYFWAVKSGQYEDLDQEAERILFDDEGWETGDERRNDSDQAQKTQDDQ